MINANIGFEPIGSHNHANASAKPPITVFVLALGLILIISNRQSEVRTNRYSSVSQIILLVTD
jgi:hypothetical protein